MGAANYDLCECGRRKAKTSRLCWTCHYPGRPHRPRQPRPFWSLVDKSGDCWLWTAGKDGVGYGRWGNDQGAHRVAWEETNGPIPPGLFVCHRCDNPACVRPSHLFLGRPKDNTQDMVRKGRARGGHPKLTPQDIVEMRALHDRGITTASLSIRFDVSKSTVKDAVSGRSWARVPARIIGKSESQSIAEAA